MQNGDETKKNLIFIEALTEAMGEGGELPVAEIKEELRADGIDLEASVSQLMEFISICSMDAKRKALDEAAETRRAIESDQRGRVRKFAAYTKDELLVRIKSLLPDPSADLSFAYRHLNGKNQEDLISILEDLEAAKELENKKSEDHS